MYRHASAASTTGQKLFGAGIAGMTSKARYPLSLPDAACQDSKCPLAPAEVLRMFHCNGKTAAYQSQSEIFCNFSYQLHVKPSGRKVEHKSGKSTFTSSFRYPKKQHSCWYASTRIFLNLKPLQHPGCHMPGWADRTKHHWAPWCRLCLATGRCLVPSSFFSTACCPPLYSKGLVPSKAGSKAACSPGELAGSNLYTQRSNTNAMMGYKLKAQI